MAVIKNFESRTDKLNRVRNEHLEMNMELEQKLNQINLRENNGGDVPETAVDDVLSLMAAMTSDRREINKLAEKCGEKPDTDKKYEKELDGFFDEYLR